MNKTFDNIRELIKNADVVLIGAGAGLSSSAGIDYYGDEYKKSFADFIDKYGNYDLYSLGFYNFPTQEEYWAYWSRHIAYSDTKREGTELYKRIYNLVKEKDYFVLTTNVDDQFYKTGFDKNKIFCVQGSLAKNQCSNACHNKLYDNTKLVEDMINSIDKDLKVSSNLVPKCPVCGGAMEPNLRKDANFVQDELWYEQNKRYEDFINKNNNKKVLLLEFGVGFNTPGIIRLPFEQMTSQNKNWILARFNKEVQCFYDLENRFIEIDKDINEIIES